jgi:lipoprotein-releasing system permease protein
MMVGMRSLRPPAGLAFELRMALRYLSPRRREGLVASVTVLCAVGVFVGVAALVVALAFMSGLQGHVKERLLASNPHVVIRPGWGDPPFAPSRVSELASIAEEDPEVLAWAPFSEEQGLLRSRLVPGGRPALVKGVDPGREDRVTGLAAATTAGAWASLGPSGAEPELEEAEEDEDEPGPLSAEDLAPPEPPSVLLGHRLALELGVVVGDLVHLVSASPELGVAGPMPRSRALRVAGLLTTGVNEYDVGLAVVGLAARRDAQGRPRVDGLQLSLKRPLASARTAGRLAERLPGDPLVTDWTTTFSRLFAAFRWERILMAVALGLIGVVAGFNIFTILGMNVMARVGDIGVLAALGADAGTITRLFVWMGLGLGGLGTLTGLAAGAAASWLLDRHQLIRLDESVYLVSHVPFDVHAGDLVVVGLGMLLVSLLSALVPARTAAGVDPVVALRAE